MNEATFSHRRSSYFPVIFQASIQPLTSLAGSQSSYATALPFIHSFCHSDNHSYFLKFLACCCFYFLHFKFCLQEKVLNRTQPHHRQPTMAAAVVSLAVVVAMMANKWLKEVERFSVIQKKLPSELVIILIVEVPRMVLWRNKDTVGGWNVFVVVGHQEVAGKPCLA